MLLSWWWKRRIHLMGTKSGHRRRRPGKRHTAERAARCGCFPCRALLQALGSFGGVQGLCGRPVRV